MKTSVKSILALVLILAVLYAASPLLLSWLLGEKLPEGWTLESLDAGYPGPGQIHIHSVKIKADTVAGRLELAADNLAFAYTSKNTQLENLSLNIYLDGPKPNSDTFEPLKFSLPLVLLPPDLPLPKVQLGKLKIQIFASQAADPPVRLVFSDLQLIASKKQAYQLNSTFSLPAYPDLTGQFDLDIGVETLDAGLRFIAMNKQQPWLQLTLSQRRTGVQSPASKLPDTEALVQLQLDSKNIPAITFVSLLNELSGGRIEEFQGQLHVSAQYAGKGPLDLQGFEVNARQLHYQSIAEDLKLEAEFRARRTAARLDLEGLAPLKIQYNNFNDKGLVPTYLPIPKHSLPLTENEILDTITLQLSQWQMQFSQLDQLQLDTFRGDIQLGWHEQQSFSISLGQSDIAADTALLELNGRLEMAANRLNFVPAQTASKFQSLNLELGQKTTEGLFQVDSDNVQLQGQLAFDFAFQEQPADKSPGANVFDFSGNLKLAAFLLEPPIQTGTPAQTIRVANALVDLELQLDHSQLLSQGKGSLRGLSLNNFSTTLTHVAADELRLDWRKFNLMMPAGQFNTRSQGLEFVLDDQVWRGFDLDLKNTLSANTKMTSKGRLLLPGSTAVKLNITGDRLSGKWRINIPATNIERADIQQLADIANVALPAPLVLGKGKIQVTAEVRLADSMKSKLKLHTGALEVSIFDNKIFTGNSQLDVQLDENISFAGPVKINRVLSIAGLEINRVSVDAKVKIDPLAEFMQSGKLTLNNLQADLLGARLTVESLNFHSGDIESSRLEFMHLDLQQFLDFAEFDGLSGSGSLDIELPIGSQGGQLFIRDGSFQSNKEGRLQYLSGSAASNIGLQALENFHYSSLGGSINYQVDGSYQLQLRLEGFNPDLYAGHPVVLNLGISGLLPEVFKSLFVTGNFEEAILNKIKTSSN